MKVCKATLKSASPYSQGRNHATKKLNKEHADDYEQRTWREKLHYNDEGYVFIPSMALKNCISECAKFLSIKYEGKKTWTKHFEAGVLVFDHLVLDVKKDDVEAQPLFVSSTGTRGAGKRVWRNFPKINSWGGTVEFFIVDDTITKDVFEHHLKEAGRFIGLGTLRVRNNGIWGRFTVEKTEWVDMG